MQLRDYQTDAVNSVLSKIGKPGRKVNPLIVAPTGAGKSLIIAALVSQISKQCLVITPRIKLLEQNSKLIEGTGILSGRLGSDTGDNHRVICGTYQTLVRRSFKTPEIIIIDEAHLVPDDDSLYADLLAKFPTTQIVGLTATPFRKKQRIYGDDKRRWTKVFDIDLSSLIMRGFLVPPVPFATSKKLIADEASDDELIQQIIPELINNLNKSRRNKVLVFCKNIRSVGLVSSLLAAQSDYRVLSIHSQQKISEQNTVYEDFDRPGKSILVNCSMLTTGVDLPAVDSIVILRRISSIALYIQIVGRGLRAYPGKTECAVYDYGYNYRYGYIDNPSFSDACPRPGTELPAKKCTNCDALNATHNKQCIVCGAEFQFRHVLSDHASDKHIISGNIRLGVVVSTLAEPVEDNYKLTHLLASGEQVISFSRTKTDLANKTVVYEQLGTFNKVLSILFTGHDGL